MMNTPSYPHTSSVTLPIITYGEVEQFVRDWISTGRSDYLQHVPKNELMAHCYLVGVDKQVIKRAFLSNGKEELIKALISTCPIVGSSTAITEDLQTFLNRSHDLYCVIHARGRINSVRQVETQLFFVNQGDQSAITTINKHQEGEQFKLIHSDNIFQPAATANSFSNQLITIRETSCTTTKEDKMFTSTTMDEINSPELSSRPRRKIRTSPKDKYRLKDYKKRLVKTTGNELK